MVTVFHEERDQDALYDVLHEVLAEEHKGVGDRIVAALIETGHLDAERHGTAWPSSLSEEDDEDEYEDEPEERDYRVTIHAAREQYEYVVMATSEEEASQKGQEAGFADGWDGITSDVRVEALS